MNPSPELRDSLFQLRVFLLGLQAILETLVADRIFVFFFGHSSVRLGARGQCHGADSAKQRVSDADFKRTRCGCAR